MKYTLEKEPIYNPFFLMQDGRLELGEVGDIVFYDETGVKFSTGKGWFGYGNNYFKEIEIPVDEIKHRKKENLTRNEVFYIPYSDDIHRRVLRLYIPCSLFSFHYEGIEHSLTNNGLQAVTTRNSTISVKGAEMEFRDGEREYVNGEHVIKLHSYEYTDTDKAKKLKKLSKELLEKCQVKLSEYDLCKIMNFFNITRKRKPNV